MTTQKQIPTDWPNRIRLAIRAAKTQAERERVAAEALVVLRRGDPMRLRERGLNAEQRAARYEEQVRRQQRAA